MPYQRKFNSYEKRKVAARQEWKCATCNILLDETYEVDHIIPLHKGGEDSLDNVDAKCVACHKKKTIAEEIERINARKTAGASVTKKPPLSCTRCQQIVSPYFTHVCEL
jgi:hypothetical protein